MSKPPSPSKHRPQFYLHTYVQKHTNNIHAYVHMFKHFIYSYFPRCEFVCAFFLKMQITRDTRARHDETRVSKVADQSTNSRSANYMPVCSQRQLIMQWPQKPECVIKKQAAIKENIYRYIYIYKVYKTKENENR